MNERKIKWNIIDQEGPKSHLYLPLKRSPTGVVAQLGARWIALLRFLGSNPGG